jgi:hypothetical protein
MLSLKRLVFGLVIGMMTISLWACEKKGPVEKAGEKIDQAAEETKEGMEEVGEAVEEKFDPQGPAEEAGEKVDEAMDPDR